MATTEFAIRERVKYGEEWDYPETREWMEETQRAWIEDFRNADEDYKEYRRTDFAALEELIAINLFGISNEIVNRAWKGVCLLRYFPIGQRLLAKKARQRMGEISGSKTVIHVQVVPIGARMDEDLQKTEGAEKDKLEKEKNKQTGRIFVFRVKDFNGNPVFLDANLRTYKTWENYLSDNKCPQCIYCYPKDGFLRKQTTNTEGEISFEANDVEFGEPPSCNLGQRIMEDLDKVVLLAEPIIAIAGSWCPAAWVLTAGLTAYKLARQGYQIWDQINHEEDYGASLMNFITTIGTMLVSKGLPMYLRRVALQNRQLNILEFIVLNGLLLGIKGSQVVSWAWMTLNLARKPILEPMDIISYTIALHNLYSCVTSPWSAEQLLKQTRVSMYYNELNRRILLTCEDIIATELTPFAEVKSELAKLIINGVGLAVIKAMESRISEKIGQLAGKILSSPQVRPQKDFEQNSKKKNDPGDPDNPGDPGHPDGPGDPGHPDGPGDPGHPDGPGDPGHPDGPGDPGHPDGPGDPGHPDGPGDPGHPDGPGDPGHPDGPGDPGHPDGPGDPGHPDGPGDPGHPDGPGDPGHPDDPDTGRNTIQDNLTIEQAEIHAELLDVVKNNFQEMMKETENLKANERRLQELKATGEDLHAIEETERNIQAGQKKIRELKSKILKDQDVFPDNKGDWMKDEQARKEYNKFREFAQSDEGRGMNTMVDQNGRIIKAVTYMDAELVFKMVSTTGSTITFSNGETMDLLINSQLDIHPSALDQMNRITNSDNKNIERNDMERMMELTRDYTVSTRDDFTGDRQAAMETYLKEIQLCLKKYQMITRLEIGKTITHTKSLTQNETLKNHLDKMTPAEAFRMRTVLEGTDERILDLALRMATAHDSSNNEINTFRLASWVEVAKMELDDFVEPTPPEDTLDRRKEYYEHLRKLEIEIAEKIYQERVERETSKRNGEDMHKIAEANEVENEYTNFNEEDDAEDLLNFYEQLRKKKIKKAEEKYQMRVNMEIAKRNGEDMHKIAEASEVENEYTNFYEKNFASWNKGGSKRDHFFRSLENETAFNRKMENLRKEINAIAEISNAESLTFPDEVAAYYHVRKHGYKSRKHFNEEKGCNIPEAENNQQYLIIIKSYLFKDCYAREKFISQDGSRMNTIYDDGKGYWGVAKCPYDADLGREVGQPTVAAHFPKITADPAPKPASEPGPTPDTEPAPAPAPAPPKQEDPQNNKDKSLLKKLVNLIF